jgi:hypothetical protein
VSVSDLETSIFSQGQGNPAFERRRSLYAAQSNVQIDAEIAKKGGFQAEISYERDK